MREIVEVGLKNFQSHKDTVVNFESGFNVVVGPSDSGKTAIKRGIESVLYNKYVGAEYIRGGEKSFSNYILFNEGLYLSSVAGIILGKTRIQIAKKYETLPIKSRKDLEITTNEIESILSINKNQLKDIIDTLINLILNNKLKNTNEDLVKYLQNNKWRYHNE